MFFIVLVTEKRVNLLPLYSYTSGLNKYLWAIQTVRNLKIIYRW